ncbi:RrF2 family transcriptional regulator [Algoriphagus marinus]|uniref:RrF2 family transcriptional regulator n=1 Tax=Algoriphagus marinus TaxID=1925762 RepID=UPI00094B9FB2|nr:Rrf2 family transcriptional regulator [Algoriphagus marinus]
MFSKACKHAINAMIYLATLPEEKASVSMKAIASATASPEPFTAKILQELVKRNLLKSTKGPNGGFSIRKPSNEVFVGEIITAIDGEIIFTGCALGMEECTESHPCGLHFKFKAIRDHLYGMLWSTSLNDLAGSIQSGKSFLKL